MARKPRSDRNHLIYLITNKVTGEEYVGLTVMRGQAVLKSLKIRFEGHIYKALVEKKDWTLPKSIREHGHLNFQIQALSIVRGKAEAHKAEVQEIDSRKPALNTKKKGEQG